jgi:hypothetical protein
VGDAVGVLGGGGTAVAVAPRAGINVEAGGGVEGCATAVVTVTAGMTDGAEACGCGAAAGNGHRFSIVSCDIVVLLPTSIL